MTPRIPPLPPEEWHEKLQPALDVGLAGGAGLGQHNIFRTLANHPKLMRAWLPFGGVLLAGGRLPPVDREILILRAGWNAGSPYEWGQHARIGVDSGMTREQVDAVPRGPADPVWTEFQRVLLNAADELRDKNCISDDTWNALAASYNTEQLLEVPLLVGHYTMLAYMLNSVGVEPDEGLEPLPGG